MKKRIACYALLTIGALLAGSALLVYVAFVRGPAHSLDAYIQAGCPRNSRQLVIAAGASSTHASLSADYVGRLRQRLGEAGYEFINAGRNGDASADLRARIDEIILCQPDVVIILIGTNDVRNHGATGAELDAFQEHYTAIVAALRAQTHARLALLSIAPLGEDTTSEINQVVNEYNAVIRQTAAQHGADYLPLYERLAEILNAHAGYQPRPYALRPMLLFMAAVRHYVLGQSWDEIAAANGFLLLTDQIHLSDRAAELIADLVAAWL